MMGDEGVVVSGKVLAGTVRWLLLFTNKDNFIFANCMCPGHCGIPWQHCGEDTAASFWFPLKRTTVI
jgi:hypothetical protein